MVVTNARSAKHGARAGYLALALLGLVASTGSVAASEVTLGQETFTVRAPTVLVDPAKDDAWKGGEAASDSWFWVSSMTSGNERIGLQVHVNLLKPPEGPQLAMVSFGLVNESTQWYRGFEKTYPLEALKIGRDGLDIQGPGFAIKGDTTQQSIHAEIPDGVIDIKADNVNPPLINKAQGLIYFLGAEQYEYAYAGMATKGTVQMGAKSYDVSGKTWYDRQFGDMPEIFARPAASGPAPMQWLWFAIQLENGVNISVTQLWEFDQRKAELVATAVLPDGTHVVGQIEPIEMSDVWVSPETGKHFPTHFKLKFPGLGADLTIDVPYKPQEIVSETTGMSKYEGMMNVTGTLRGEPVTGEGYAEMVGRW